MVVMDKVAALMKNSEKQIVHGVTVFLIKQQEALVEHVRDCVGGWSML